MVESASQPWNTKGSTKRPDTFAGSNVIVWAPANSTCGSRNQKFPMPQSAAWMTSVVANVGPGRVIAAAIPVGASTVGFCRW